MSPPLYNGLRVDHMLAPERKQNDTEDVTCSKNSKKDITISNVLYAQIAQMLLFFALQKVLTILQQKKMQLFLFHTVRLKRPSTNDLS